MLSEGLQARGDVAASNRVLNQSRQIAQAVRLDDLLAQMNAPQPVTAPTNPLLVPGDSRKGESMP
jgi:hypothetical protein